MENDGSTKYSRAYLICVLAILSLLNVCNQWARNLFGYLYAVAETNDDRSDFKSIAGDTGITEVEYSFLSGMAFAVFFVLTGLFVGRSADVMSRRVLIGIGGCIWNIGLIFMATANGFFGLLVSRIFLGIGQSFIAPSNISLLADYFPREERAQATSIYSFGIYVGTGISSLSIIMSESIGWRATTYIVFAIGSLITILSVFIVRSPPRQEAIPSSSSTFTFSSWTHDTYSTIALLLRNPFTFKLILASCFRYMGGYISLYYLAIFYERNFSINDEDTFATVNAVGLCVIGAFSAYSGGYIADSWETSNPNSRTDIPAISSFLGVPTIFLALFFNNNIKISLFFLLLSYLLGEMWIGPVISTQQNILSNRQRGTGYSFFSGVTILSGSLAALIFGLIDASVDNIRVEMMISVCVLYFLSGVVFTMARGDRELIKNDFVEDFGANGNHSNLDNDENENDLKKKKKKSSFRDYNHYNQEQDKSENGNSSTETTPLVTKP